MQMVCSSFQYQSVAIIDDAKNVCISSQAFWREKGFSGEIVAGSSTECPFCVTFDATSPFGNAALVGFIAGQQASHWEPKEVMEKCCREAFK